MPDVIEYASTSDKTLKRLLEAHPLVQRTENGPDLLTFKVGSWTRHVCLDRPEIETGGLIELMDNNPLVCADKVSMPDASTTLALIALGPLIEAGILVEAPVLLSDLMPPNQAFLEKLGWEEGVLHQEVTGDLGSVHVLTAICRVRNPERLEELDELYRERYSRSFFIRESHAEEWDVRLVAGKPYAVYQLGITPGDPDSLLTIKVLADRDGKCGAAQIVHAMNVMAGLEEHLGIQEPVA